jgi:small-conductance mechanosensitive channel
MLNAIQGLDVFLKSSGIALISIVVGLIVYFVLMRILKSIAATTESVLFPSLVKHFRAPLLMLLPLIGLSIGISSTGLSAQDLETVRHALSILITIAMSWLAARFIAVIEDLVMSKFEIDVKDNLRARKVQTQMQWFKRAMIVFIALIGLSIILTSFSKVRQLGTTILASAGVIGIIIGFAARQSIATLVAGLQIAVTQPIRIDDVVVVEGEWGRIEEIRLTYVVVRIWDLRRLILPITYFIETPFQNWTRVSADILGTVFLYVDYTVPVNEIREELHRILLQSENWDGKVWVLQVTGTNDKTVELRALMSAQDSSIAWNLRCEVREKLLDYLQSHYPDALPKIRGTLTGPDQGVKPHGPGK